ncbi:TadE/TadG family type IV pilus assembly protein [Microbacterium sp. NPDC077184]|uniref:TadE family protein n=1 Tax=Microbacterium sp. NPDC077184 TaxID=3154764 RepID=UPI003428F3FF
MARGERSRAAEESDRSGGDDAGSAPVEFILVGMILTALTLGVLQLGLAVYVRNVVHDAAVEGAFHAALADTEDREGIERTRQVITRAIGTAYAEDIAVTESVVSGAPTVTVRVRAPLPVLGLWGVPGAWEVSANAPAESFD